MLTEHQITVIDQYLDDIPRMRPEVKEELLDHLCCAVESRIAKGDQFSKAWQDSRTEMNENEVAQLIHSLAKNRRKMLKLFVAAMAVILTSMPLWWSSGEKASVSSSSEPVMMTSCLLLDPPSTNPLDGDTKVTSDFGMRIHPLSKERVLHRGIDWKAPAGTLVKAAGKGEVVAAGEEGKYGLCIRIRHDANYETLYAHLSEILVEKGQQVEATATIGKVGSTGASMAPHLHYEVIRNGQAVNPADYLP